METTIKTGLIESRKVCLIKFFIMSKFPVEKAKTQANGITIYKTNILKN